MTQGTRNVLAAAKGAGVERFVLMSALGTTATTKDVVPYFGAKWAMEQDTIGVGARVHDLPPELRVRPRRCARDVHETGPLLAGRHRDRLRAGSRIQPIWIDDVAEHFARALDTPAAANKTFEIGGPDIVTWDELYRTIAKVLGKRACLVHIPALLARTGARAHPVGPRRAADHRPGRDDRSRRQRRHEHRCRPHLPAPARPARRPDPPRRPEPRLSLLLLLVAAHQRMVQLVERELAADGVDANGYGVAQPDRRPRSSCA